MKLFLILIICACQAGCNTEINIKNLSGRYCLNQGSRDSIIIKSDYTYIHKFLLKGGDTKITEGHWKYNLSNSEITFEDYIPLNNSKVERWPSGNWFSKVDINSSGNVILVYSKENDVYYEKINK